MTAAQLAVLLAAHLTIWTTVAWLLDRQAARRAAAQHEIDQQLTNALRELFEQRTRP